MKTIKVIDLLNKIANREEVPKQIKYNGVEYEKNDGNRTYFNGVPHNTMCIDTYFLNEEVEITEEEKEKKDNFTGVRCFKNGEVVFSYYNGDIPPLRTEIRKIETHDSYIVNNANGETNYLTTNRKDREVYIKKINELIDAYNELRKEK